MFFQMFTSSRGRSYEIGADYLWHRAREVVHIKDLEICRNRLVPDDLLTQEAKIGLSH